MPALNWRGNPDPSRKTKLVGAAAFSVALLAGGAAGAVLGTPVLSGAQESGTETVEPAQGPAPGRGEGEVHVRHHAGAKADLTAAAEVLGMTEEELRTELEAGKSLATIAAERNVDKQAVIDALVASASARLDELKAELPERMAELVEREGLGHRGEHHRGARIGLFNAVDDAATALGISRQELLDALEGGASIASVAEAKGKSLDEVKAAMIADATARIDQAVEDGRIDEAKATELKAALGEKIDALLQREGLPKPRHHRGGPGMPPPDADADAEESSFTA